MQPFCDSTQNIFNLNILSAYALSFLFQNVQFNAHTYIQVDKNDLTFKASCIEMEGRECESCNVAAGIQGTANEKVRGLHWSHWQKLP